MHTELRYGKGKYLSFLFFDIACIILANFLSFYFFSGNRNTVYKIENHYSVMAVMVLIDIGVTFAFSTLRRVLRWRKRRE